MNDLHNNLFMADPDPYWFAGAESQSVYEGLWALQLPSPTGSAGPRAPLSLPRAVSVCSDLAESVDTSFCPPSNVSSTKSSKSMSLVVEELDLS